MAGIPPYPPAPHPVTELQSRLITRPWLAFFQQLLQVINTIVSGINQLTGDVVAGPGTGSQPSTISNNVVSFAKMQDINTQRLIGRNTAGIGDPEEVTISQALDWLGP